jgi:uncharacterized protein (UPF0212 family)
MSRAVDLLTIWEAASGLNPLARAQALARWARPDRASPVAVGVAYADIFALRRALFGSQLVALATCPSCGARLETAMAVEDFLAAPGDETQAVHCLDNGPEAIRFRLPTLDDLAKISADCSPDEAAEALLEACVVTADRRAATAARDRALARMAELDPLADASIALRCEDCGAEFDCAFDISQFLWREIEAASARLFGEVHVLARRYGWSEAEILAMTAQRRQVYLDLIDA